MSTQRVDDHYHISFESLRKTVEVLNTGISHLSLEGKILWANPYYCNLLGYTLEELRAIHVSQTTHPDDRALQGEQIRKLVSGELSHLSFNKRFLRKDGTVVWGNLMGSIIRDAAGAPQFCVGVSRDISDIKEAEREAQLYQRQLEDAEVIANFGSWERDLVGGRLVWSSGGFKIFGLDPGKTKLSFELFMEMVHPDDRARLMAELKAANTEKRSFEVEYRINRADGVPRELRVRGRFFTNEKGMSVRTIGAMQDVTEIRTKERIIAEQQRALAHSDKLASIGTLAAGVAHEINNPLTVIKGNIGILADRIAQLGESAEVTRILDRQKTAVDRMAKIVNGLRTFARADTDVVEPVDLHAAINGTLALCQAYYAKEGLTIEVRPGSKHPVIKGNMGMLQQVFMNLFTNAKDACEGVEGARLVVETLDDGDSVSVRVSDNGAGIAGEHLPKIFDAFYTTKAPGKGTGLGLSISSSIVQSMGGALSVESALKVGTTFILKFSKRS